MSTAVFLTSLLYTSLPTMGQNGTLLPSSCATPSARAVLPVPGAPAQLLVCIEVWIARSKPRRMSRHCAEDMLPWKLPQHVLLSVMDMQNVNRPDAQC